MKKASIDDIELGNLMFGYSRGEYSVRPREDYEEMFHIFLDRFGFDSYGYLIGSKERVFENSTFVIRPYYWGDDENEASKPNFEHKPTQLEIRWYKYPMRDAYCNKDITVDEFAKILAECGRSIVETREYIAKREEENIGNHVYIGRFEKVQELIRCENCQFHYAGENEVDAWDRCRLHSINTETDNFCSWAVKRNG